MAESPGFLLAFLLVWKVPMIGVPVLLFVTGLVMFCRYQGGERGYLMRQIRESHERPLGTYIPSDVMEDPSNAFYHEGT